MVDSGARKPVFPKRTLAQGVSFNKIRLLESILITHLLVKETVHGIPGEEEIGAHEIMIFHKQAPSLVDLCVRTAIDNIRYLGDVGETDLHLLDRILPHCTIDQLMHVEKSSKGRDLTPVTDKLWKKFYEKQFGCKSTNLVIERMKKKKVAFRWIQLYEAKLKDVQEAEIKAVDRLKQLYKKEDARKQSRQIQICTKVPPNNKRGFWGGSGPGYNIGNTKSNLMKKAKLDLLNSQEMKNLAAMKKNAVQKSSSSSIKPSELRGNYSASTSKHSRPLDRRL